MNENELMSKLLSPVTNYTNWIDLYEKSGLGKNNEIFILLKDFSDKYTRMGDDSKNQSFDGLNTIEIMGRIFILYNRDEKVKKFLDSL
jgi:hypothetical protein